MGIRILEMPRLSGKECGYLLYVLWAQERGNSDTLRMPSLGWVNDRHVKWLASGTRKKRECSTFQLSVAEITCEQSFEDEVLQ